MKKYKKKLNLFGDFNVELQACPLGASTLGAHHPPVEIRVAEMMEGAHEDRFTFVPQWQETLHMKFLDQIHQTQSSGFQA